jgi:hypothetical protein
MRYANRPCSGMRAMSKELRARLGCPPSQLSWRMRGAFLLGVMFCSVLLLSLKHRSDS